MIGGKPVTVQMPVQGGGNKTLTFVQQHGQNKVLRLPLTSTVAQAGGTETTKLMVLNRPKQPSASIGKIFYSWLMLGVVNIEI